MRTAAAQEANAFDDEIVAMTTTKAVFNKETKETTYEEVTLGKDEGLAPTRVDVLSEDLSVPMHQAHITDQQLISLERHPTLGA